MKDEIEFQKKSKQVGEDLMNWMNSMDEQSRFEALSKVIMNEHRTLQQSLMKFFIYQMNQWATTTYFDARNEATVKKCQKIMEAIKDDTYLPMI